MPVVVLTYCIQLTVILRLVLNPFLSVFRSHLTQVACKNFYQLGLRGSIHCSQVMTLKYRCLQKKSPIIVCCQTLQLYLHNHCQCLSISSDIRLSFDFARFQRISTVVLVEIASAGLSRRPSRHGSGWPDEAFELTGWSWLPWLSLWLERDRFAVCAVFVKRWIMSACWSNCSHACVDKVRVSVVNHIWINSSCMSIFTTCGSLILTIIVPATEISRGGWSLSVGLSKHLFESMTMKCLPFRLGVFRELICRCRPGGMAGNRPAYCWASGRPSSSINLVWCCEVPKLTRRV